MAPHSVSADAVKDLPLDIPSKDASSASKLQIEDADQIDLVLRTFRCLIADLCEQFGGGHPGSAMGMAAIGVALWKYVMRYSPSNPDFFNRDRFVLSNGHACLWQYTFMHLLGYKNMTLDQLKSYHSDRYDSICPGHPEIEHKGIEVTTGPLGQGLANACGLAMATKHLGTVYNRPGFPVVNNKTYCIIGDACLQEGVGLEAFSLAAHWRLNNLIVIYDDNQITCDGSVDLVNNEDVDAKVKATGWHVINVEDGNHDVEGIVRALAEARSIEDMPVFVHIKTIIGIGSNVAGDAKAHGAAYGAENVQKIKETFGLNPDEHFVISKQVYSFFNEVKSRGERVEEEYNDLLETYEMEHPTLASEFAKRRRGEFVKDWTTIIPTKDSLPTNPTPSRKSAGLVCNPLAAEIPNFMVGTADLSPSVNMIWKGKVDFQHPDLRTACGINGNYAGRYIHWGVREFAMAAVSNGLAAFRRGTIVPITSSFFMFYIYAAPGIRMGALMGLQTIHIATHDSIGTGEDGPTHQPIELANLYRSMPNLQYIRPADSEETAGAFIAALEAKTLPTIISLSRQNLPQYPQYSSREGTTRGAYVFLEQEDADVTLIGVGAEMVFAVKTRDVLLEKFHIKARIVSFPSQRLFERQTREYRESVLKVRSGIPRVVIEAYAVNGWERYADAGYSMSTFGHSLPGAVAYKFFGFDENAIAPRIADLVQEVQKGGVDMLRGDFRDLNLTKH